MGNGESRHRVPRLLASILMVAATVLGVYEGPSGNQARRTSGFIDTLPGSGVIGLPTSGASGIEDSADRGGRIHGSLIDEDGLAVGGIEVELIPSGQSELEEEWGRRQSVWSSKSGEYEFRNVPQGEYFVGVHVKEAPDGKLPFQTAYYPGTSQQAEAQKVYVAENDHVSLQWIRLQGIETIAIPISLRWRDGEKVERGNLLFNNLSYPDSAPVGGFAPQIDNGEGTITLPLGFQYRARAKVDCDTGSKIETIESRPVQTFLVNENQHPEKLVFVIPSLKCELWRPRP